MSGGTGKADTKPLPAKVREIGPTPLDRARDCARSANVGPAGQSKGVETVAQETLPAPVSAPAPSGDVTVLDTADQMKMLAQNEQNIRRNLKKFESSRDEVIRSLTVIRFNKLWRLHKVGGKPAYTNFKEYIRGEFPEWTLTPERALQLMKDAEPKMIEDGIIEGTGATREGQEREAPPLTAAQFAKTTYKQFEGRRDAVTTRLDRLEGGVPSTEVKAIWDAFTPHLSTFLSDLEAFVEQQEAESATADEAKAS